MSKLAIVVLVLIIFIIFSVVVLFGVRSSKKPKDTLLVKLDKNSEIKIYQDKDEAIRVEYTSFDERPRAYETHPELLDDLNEQEEILDRAFWEKYAHFDECSPEEQKEMIRKLVQHGFFRYDEANDFEIEPPVDENGKQVELPPDPTDEDAYMAFWTRPLES